MKIMQCRWRNTGQSTVEEHNSSPYRLWNSEDAHLLLDRCTWSSAACRHTFFYYRQQTQNMRDTRTHTYIDIQTHAYIHRHKCRLTKANPYQWAQLDGYVMAHGDAREGKWRGNWRMEWLASTLHTTSERGVSSITTADVHTSAASSGLNWRPRRFKWTLPFRRKTKSGFCACAITFQTQSTTFICTRSNWK